MEKGSCLYYTVPYSEWADYRRVQHMKHANNYQLSNISYMNARKRRVPLLYESVNLNYIFVSVRDCGRI